MWLHRTTTARSSSRQCLWSRGFAKGGKVGRQAGGGIPGDFVAHLKEVNCILPNGQRLFENIHLAFLRGAKIGVLGPNGCGKSTLMKILAHVQKDFEGERWVKEGLRIGYLPQEPELDPKKNVYENIMDGLAESTQLLDAFDAISAKMGEPDADFDTLLDQQADLQAKIDHLDCWNLSHEVERAMLKLRVPPPDADVNVLSGGERRRVALCRLLLEKPEMLLLDEPTNHLDAESVRWLEEFLQNYKGTVLSITHDRYFLENVAGWILEIDRGRTYALQGNYTNFLEQKQKRLDTEQKSDRNRMKMVQSELEWIMTHQGRKKASKSRLKQIEASKNDEDSIARVDAGQIVIPSGPRLGHKVLSVKGVSKSFQDKNLFQNLSFELTPGSTVGIIGGNGMGKSTLLDIISGKIKPDSGTIEFGSSVHLGHVSQSRAELNPKNTVYEEISGGREFIMMGNREVHIRAYIAAFNLRGPAQEKKIGKLSGGERNRVQLAKVLLKGYNVVFLDEPTNDLDVDTLRSLENALKAFDGVSVVISHDRWFLDRIATHIIAFQGHGNVEVFHAMAMGVTVGLAIAKTRAEMEAVRRRRDIKKTMESTDNVPR